MSFTSDPRAGSRKAMGNLWDRTFSKVNRTVGRIGIQARDSQDSGLVRFDLETVTGFV